MSRFPFLAILSALALQGCAATHQQNAELQTISLIDRNGMTETINNPDRIKQYKKINFLHPQPYDKVLCIHKRSREGNIPSFLYSYHDNGQLKQYLEIVNSRAQGIYQEWYPNGRLKLQANVVGGAADLNHTAERSWIFDGVAYAWDEDGRLKAEIPYAKGVLTGNSLYYHPNGKIWKIIPFCEGKAHGKTEIYLSDGQLFQTSEYDQGKLEGHLCRFWDSNQIATKEEYQNNHLIFGRYYDQKGNVISEINEGNGFKALFNKTQMIELHEYRNGQLEGELQVFDSHGLLRRKFHVKNGLKHGEEIELYETSEMPKLLISWHEGKVQGTAKTWYDNGVQESDRELSNNAKNGVSIAWYREGSLRLIEEYSQDKLIKGEYFRKGDKKAISRVKDGSGTATLFDSEGHFLEKVLYEDGVPIGVG